MSKTDSPLIVLVKRLRTRGPPSLTALTAFFEDSEDYCDFISIIREFLPERERDILQEAAPEYQMATFASYFEDRYFPLEQYLGEGLGECYSDITRWIPIIPLGYSMEDYHYMDNARESIQLMSYLVPPPMEEENARIAIGDLCALIVSVDLLRLVPRGGFLLEDLTTLLKDTPYAGLVDWANILQCDTGNFFLDTSGEELFQCGYIDELNWEMERVQFLTQDWLQAMAIQENVESLLRWLEKDLPGHFEKMLNFILAKMEVNNADSQSSKAIPL